MCKTKRKNLLNMGGFRCGCGTVSEFFGDYLTMFCMMTILRNMKSLIETRLLTAVVFLF